MPPVGEKKIEFGHPILLHSMENKQYNVQSNYTETEGLYYPEEYYGLKPAEAEYTRPSMESMQRATDKTFANSVINNNTEDTLFILEHLGVTKNVVLEALDYACNYDRLEVGKTIFDYLVNRPSEEDVYASDIKVIDMGCVSIGKEDYAGVEMMEDCTSTQYIINSLIDTYGNDECSY